MTTRSRLITTVFRPDVWFVMPPACNVVFPEECVSVAYTRQMMRETTRLELQTFVGILSTGASGLADQLLQNYFFAPALSEGGPTLPGVLGTPKKAPTTDDSAPVVFVGSALENVMYSHEKFTGIIPKIERIPDTAFYAAQQAAQEGGPLPEGLPTIEEYAQRVALFNFLRNRYLARQANVSGVFMPRLVAGFPALVVNRPKETDTDDPTHFIGMITNVSHTLNQDGGTTSFSLAYARPHTVAREEDTFLQFLQSVKESTPAKETNAAYGGENQAEVVTLNQQLIEIAMKMVAADQDPLAGLYRPLSQGYYDVANTKAVEFGSALLRPGITATFFTATVVLLSKPLDHVCTYAELVTERPTDLAGQKAFDAAFSLFAIYKSGSSFDPIEELVSSDGNTYPVVLSFSLKEAAKTVTRSFEELITPPWFSDMYKNYAIGAYYTRLLGCGSMGSTFGESNTVEAAARKVVDAYSASDHVKENAGDPAFIYQNTKREIPTQAEVLEFHRFAFTASPLPLYGLDEAGGGVMEVNEGHIARNRVATEEELEFAGAATLDPRQERYTAVKSYHDQLIGRRAFRG